MRNKFSAAYAASLLTLAACGNFAPPDETKRIDRETVKRAELMGHRGARGLWPENTWPAFQSAISHGMTTIELDLVLTADNDLIIHHDTSTNPRLCLGANGKKLFATSIYKLTVAELKKLDCGSLKDEKFPEQQPVPGTQLLTLTEMFALVQTFEAQEPAAASVRFNLDAKFPARKTPSDKELRDFASLLIGKVKAAGMLDRSMVQSFELRLLPYIREFAPEIKTAALFQWSGWPGIPHRSRETLVSMTQAAKADIIAPNRRDTNRRLVTLAHAYGLAVIPWTVNESDEMQSLFAMGVDGIITDYPDRLKRVADNLLKPAAIAVDRQK